MSLHTGVDNMGRPLPVFALGASQNVSYNAAGGAAVASTAFGNTTYAIMISVTDGAVVRIAIGNDPTATSTSTRIPGPALLIFAAPPGGKISALSNDATPGSINVTEIVGNSRSNFIG